MLASQAASLARCAAEGAASEIPQALLRPRQQRAELAQAYRRQLEADRRRDTIAVPGLSDAALAAIATLQQAEAEWRPGVEDVPLHRLSAAETGRAERVAIAWSAIRRDPGLRAEVTEQLVDRHAAIEAARKTEQQKAERVERDAREKEARRLEMEKQFQEF